MTRSIMTICTAVSLIVAVTSVATADIMVNVVPSSAPNYGTTTFNTYVTNALNSLENGLGNIGDRATDPTAYEIAGPIVHPGDILVTSFTSWRAVASPPSPFDQQHGNRMHFGLHIVGDGTTQFRLNELTFDMHSSDPTDSLAFVDDFIGYSYSSTRFGVDWGPDRVKGGGDDIVYTSGNGMTLVDEIAYVGVGNAWWPAGDEPDPANPVGGAQASIDDAIAWIGSIYPIDFTTTYSMYAPDGITLLGSGSASITVIPAPGAVVLGWIGLGLVGWLKRRFA